MEKPWAETIYRPAAALAFFKVAGKPERAPAGTAFFAENEKARPYLFMRDKMYLLLDGSVELVARRKVIGSIAKGQIFGEMASITHAPRSATAVAKTACKVIALDDKQFLSGLQRKPDFAKLAEQTSMRSAEVRKESVVFDAKRLAELADGLSNEPPIYFDRGKAIVEEGQPGLRMYAVIEGRVAVSIGKDVVERLGPGGVFGELALVGQMPRMASVAAETDCSLLPINRTAFLLLVKTNAEFAASLLGSLAERLRALTARLK
jgi:CRP-like cAMP-binding protein